MRSIKFRCYIKDEALETLNKAHFARPEIGRMFDVELIDFDGETVEILCPSRIGLTFNDVELLQCTGLKDKNYKEICEGDIVEGKSWKEPYAMRTFKMFRSVVIFHKGKFTTDWFKKERKLPGRTIPQIGDHIEIIGNIWENGDLLDDIK